jgi:hypothetical protein
MGKKENRWLDYLSIVGALLGGSFALLRAFISALQSRL